MGFNVADKDGDKPDQSEQIKIVIEKALQEGLLQKGLDKIPDDGGWKSRKLALTAIGGVIIIISIIYWGVNPDVGISTLTALIASYSASNAMAKGKVTS